MFISTSAKIVVTAGFLFSSTTFAASRFYYDVQKFEAILNSKDVEAKIGMSTLDGIDLVNIDQAKREITYQLRTQKGGCTVPVVLSFDIGLAPNYQVTSVGVVNCN